MADLTQSEDYKVLQAMRTEISGLVDSKNRLDLEIKQLEENKVQAELEASAVTSKLSDVSGEWSKKMRELLDKENALREKEITLTTERQIFDKEQKEREDALNYTESKANSRDAIIQQKEADIAKRESAVKGEEQRIGQERADFQKKIAEIEQREVNIKGRETQIIEREIDVQNFNAKQLKREVDLQEKEVGLRELEGQVAKASTKAMEEVSSRERKVQTRENEVTHRELEVEKKMASMDTRITKREADEIRALKAAVESDKMKLAREKSEFEIQKQNHKGEYHRLQEEVIAKRQELSGVQDKLAEIERREKGVADSEAGVQAREKQLMFEIAKFKKKIKDAHMEETINESG